MQKASKETLPIDFVIAWVDGNDKNWQKEKAAYSKDKNFDNRESKYRDWDLLRYWFRGVEKFAPWVNKIHFVTYGHLPNWLDTECPKLDIVNHRDFIPQKYLPTFSSHTIELNLHRIAGLSEYFSYFNDDMYIVAPTNPQDFFEKRLPKDRAVLTINCPKESWEIQHINNQDTSLINEEFSFRRSIKNNLENWFNLKNGKENLRNLWLLPCPRFPGLKHEHANSNLLKSTCEEIWKKSPEILDRTCQNKFRTHLDVNQWVFKDWQIASGHFVPSSRISTFIDLKYNEKIEEAASVIRNQKAKILCINDAENIDEKTFSKMKETLSNAFEALLPDKSKFEK